MKKRRTAEEGRSLVSQFNESGLTQQAFVERQGITKCSLNYWRKRLSRIDGLKSAPAQNRFVEISIPSGGASALKITLGRLEMSFTNLPPPKWMLEFVLLFDARQ